MNVFGENDAAIDGSGAAGGDSCEGFIAASEDFADTACSIFRWDAFYVGVREKKLFALRESYGMRRNGAKIGESGARTADELMLNVKDGFRDHAEVAFEEKIVNADDGACECVFDRSEKGVCGAFGNGLEGGIKGGARNGSDGVAEELNGGGFAERAGFALKGDACRT